MPTAIPSISDIADFLERSSKENTDATPLFSADSLLALYSIGYELYRNGKYEDAKTFFRLLTLADSFERKHWMGLAACFQMLKDYEKALECYSAAAVQDPSDPYAHWHAAECFFHSDNLSKAKEALESALVTAKEDPAHNALVPKLELLSAAWSTLPHGGSYDRSH